MSQKTKRQVFDPHETARAETLAGVPLASFGSRLAAFGLDFAIAGLFFIPLEMLYQYLLARWHGVEPHINVNFDFHDLHSLFFLVIYFGLAVYWGNGQTFGKRLLHIRIVSLVNERMTLWQSFERALGYGASMLEGGFGFIQYFIHHNRCCVHDRIAETIVVKEPKTAGIQQT